MYVLLLLHPTPRTGHLSGQGRGGLPRLRPLGTIPGRPRRATRPPDAGACEGGRAAQAGLLRAPFAWTLLDGVPSPERRRRPQAWRPHPAPWREGVGQAPPGHARTFQRLAGTTPPPSRKPVLRPDRPARASGHLAAQGRGTRGRSPAPPQGSRRPAPSSLNALVFLCVLLASERDTLDSVATGIASSHAEAGSTRGAALALPPRSPEPRTLPNGGVLARASAD